MLSKNCFAWGYVAEIANMLRIVLWPSFCSLATTCAPRCAFDLIKRAEEWIPSGRAAVGGCDRTARGRWGCDGTARGRWGCNGTTRGGR
jgi:hypothetical protein